MMIDLATDFSPYPSGRVPDDGTFNGEAFRIKHLDTALDRLSKQRGSGEVITIDIDGVRSFGSSFLEEAFGGVIRLTKHDPKWAADMIKIQSKHSHLKMYQDSIVEYISDALKKRQTAI